MLVLTSLSHKPQWWGLAYTWMHPRGHRLADRGALEALLRDQWALILTSIIFMGLMIRRVGSLFSLGSTSLAAA